MGKMLVTGAAGFVGRHLTRALLEQGHEVHAVDSIRPLTGAVDPASGWPLFEPRDYHGFHFHREDCRDWFRRNPGPGFDAAFHLAAMVGGRLMIENNPLAVADDLGIDAAFFQWAAEARPGRSAVFSSSAAYPVRLQRREEYVLLAEEMIRLDGDIGLPDMSYGWAKLTAEYLARLAHQRHGLRMICFRPFSGYGEDQDAAYPFPAICRRVLDRRGAPVLQVWGSGQQMRDFIHVDDCIRGVLGMLDRIEDGSAVNLSTGILTSFTTLAGMAAELAGWRPEIRGLSDRPEGVFARAGCTRLQEQLGFRPRINLRTGIDRALQHLAVPA
ncbi:NAD-dependent epimerase/dehydratase family protein [Dankookia rubra]|uniref:NAD-dependent epimerase/dehydratase family protein n=1 Tax=Dankookia rubra TaxID=1442381 RepID=A0A4R5QA49_9PROT|nr:NAD-dependent epimerase/dehydratase family protein [Dankookia rubra]TDH59418.1 NAD-dependent epimerase/dehydratase family protein [Dankookia rubra]